MRGVNSISAVLQWKRYGRKAVYTASILLFILSSLTIFPLSFDSEGADATSGFAIPSETTITLVSTSNIASVNLVVDNIAGTFASSTSEQEAAFSVYTNNYTGYTLSVSSEDNTGRLLNNTAYMESIPSAVTAESFDNTSNNNKWGFRPSSYVDGNDTVVSNTGNDALFLPAPTSVATALDVTTAANDESESNEYSIALGARADINIPEGTYTGTFNLVATGNPVPYIIVYNKNTNDTVANMPLSQASSTNADYMVLSSNVPSRDNHIFLGWCPSQPTNSNGIDICSGTVYQPGDDYGLDHTTTTNDTLYAMWQSGTTRTYLQDITPESCPSQPTVVFDIRDGEPYTIQKLADGNCWMLDNLRLGNGSTTVVLTPADTNITSNFTLPASVNQDFNDYTQPQINTDYETRSAFYGVTGEGKVGTYYNFCAATAGTYCAPIGESTGTPTEDICPKGWRLPTGGETGEYQTLYAAYADYAEFKNTLRSPLSGYFKYAEVNHIGSYGSFWSSTPVGDDRMYSLDVRLASVPSDFTSYRTAGISIRCVKEGVLMAIQDITADTCPTTPTMVYDERDGERYYIQKLKDDNCWILDNLRLDSETLQTSLTSENTNISSEIEFTLPAGTDSIDSPEQPQSITNRKNEVVSFNSVSGKAGVYYNYCAATAGTVCYEDGKDFYGDAEYDICPAGWHIPNYDETEILRDTYNDIMVKAMHAVPTGVYYESGLYDQGDENFIAEYFWTSTSQKNRLTSGEDAYAIYIEAADYAFASIDEYWMGETGMSVRCMASNNQITYIQDITPDTCPTTPTVVYDMRDSEKYTIQKLADGKCWMLENLRLDTDGGESRIILPGKSEINDNGSIEERDVFEEYTYSSGGTYYESYINSTNSELMLDYESGRQEKAGVYYNYCSASGDPLGGCNYYKKESVQSVCPFGWRLPTGGSSGELKALYDAYGNSASFNSAFRTVRPGAYKYDSVDGFGSQGYYWSSTFNQDINELYYLSVKGNTVNPEDSGEIAYNDGASVRCVARETPKYIQDVTIETCPSITTSVFDIRDGRKYVIKKLADGNCWMQKDLNVGKTSFVTKMTSEDTNLAPGMEYDMNNYTLKSSINSYTVPQLKGTNTPWGGSQEYYYNYCAVSAGTICSDSNTEDAQYDICPKGWRLPTGGDSGEYARLYNAYGDVASFRSALDVWIGGIIVGQNRYYVPVQSNGAIYFEAQGEYYKFLWTSTHDTTNSSGQLRMYYTQIRYSIDEVSFSGSASNAGNLRKNGVQVRCMIKDNNAVAQNVHYDANGGTGAMTDATDIVFSIITAASNGFTRTGFEFTGWNTAANGSGTSVAEGDSLLAAATAMGVANGGTLTLYAQWSPVYLISYDGNNSDAGTMTNVYNNVQIDDSIGLIASNYSRAGYGFAGWSLDADAGTKLANGQSVTVYGPNQAIKVTAALLAEADAVNNVTLYAVWLAPQDTTKTMQTFTASECTAMTTGSVIALKDTRDDEVYTVAKLGDGHCWMTENLRINPATANITADNTNGPTQAFLDALATATDATTLCNSNNSGCDDTIKYNLNDLNRSLTASPTANNNSSSWYSYGGMYNWYTATAGNGLYSRSSGSVTNDGDICPTGWRLPTGGSGGEYQALNTAINGGSTTSSTNLVSFPANFVYSGDYNYNTAGGRGTYARLWSATATSNANAYRMGVAPAEVTPLKNWNKWDGFGVRCIAK